MSIIAEREFPGAPPTGKEAFSFRVPDSPYSFSGQLISLIWAVDLVVEPGDGFERVEIVVGPDGTEVDLTDGAPHEQTTRLPASRVI